MKQRMKVLVIEDMEKKRAEIRSKLNSYCKSIELEFSDAGNYEEAREKLKGSRVDIVILDLKIPAGDEEPDEKWSRKILNDIIDGALCYPMHVFGLTQHSDLIAEVEQYYTRNMFGLFSFSWDADDWATEISNKIIYLARAVENGASYRLNTYDYDIIILTARYKNEFVPVRNVLFGDRSPERHPLWPAEVSHFGRLKIDGGFARCGLICIGETGLAPAAAVSSQAIQTLRPKLIVMLGMCAGFASKDMKLLDIVVARETACWQEGKNIDRDEEERFDTRQKIRGWSAALGSRIEQELEVRSQEIASVLQSQKETLAYERIRQKLGVKVSDGFAIRAGLMLSGSSVVASSKKQEEIIKRHPSAIGLDMEAYAVYTAGQRAMGLKPEFIAVKCVADLADGGKGDEAQSFASELSARAFYALVSWQHV